MIARLSTEFPVKTLCHTLGVSRSGYLAARGREPGPRQKANQELTSRIRGVFDRGRRVYGSPRVTKEVQAQGVKCGENRVARLMRAEGLRAKARKRFRPKAPARVAGQPVCPNRLPEWRPATQARQRRQP
jgi:putative transposase